MGVFHLPKDGNSGSNLLLPICQPSPFTPVVWSNFQSIENCLASAFYPQSWNAVALQPALRSRRWLFRFLLKTSTSSSVCYKHASVFPIEKPACDRSACNRCVQVLDLGLPAAHFPRTFLVNRSIEPSRKRCFKLLLSPSLYTLGLSFNLLFFPCIMSFRDCPFGFSAFVIFLQICNLLYPSR